MRWVGKVGVGEGEGEGEGEGGGEESTVYLNSSCTCNIASVYLGLKTFLVFISPQKVYNRFKTVNLNHVGL